MAIRNQEALYELINTKLNDNTYDVTFRTDLFNAGTSKYYTVDDYGQKHRFVPTMITDVIGEYINIPNANSTSNQVGISFDIFVDKEGQVNDRDITEFEDVSYTDTLNAIEEFKSSLLAQYFPLGTPYLFMGGEDSKVIITNAIYGEYQFVYLNFKPYNTDEENIFRGDDDSSHYLYKDATHLYYYINASHTLSIPYVANVEIELKIYSTGTTWVMTDGTNDDTTTVTSVPTSDTFIIGLTSGEYIGQTGFEGLIKRIVVSNDLETEVDDLDTLLIDISTWSSKDEVINSGTYVLTSGAISNSILWSEDGNAIFGFGTLNPVTDIRPIDGGVLYQSFELEMTVFISNDLLFGNNFEYYLDGVQVYPVDRQHTLGTDIGSAQLINGNYNEHIIEESSREHTLSFYYIPTKQLTSLLKHVVSGDTEQNTDYTLLVQYPFFQVSYDVIVDSGGTSPNINTLSTFTVTLKRKSTVLT